MEATCEFLRSFGCLECDLERLRDIERERERDTFPATAISYLIRGPTQPDSGFSGEVKGLESYERRFANFSLAKVGLFPSKPSTSSNCQAVGVHASCPKLC